MSTEESMIAIVIAVGVSIVFIIFLFCVTRTIWVITDIIIEENKIHKSCKQPEPEVKNAN